MFPVSGIVRPPAVTRQFVFVIFISAGQVARCTVTGIAHIVVSFLVPLVKPVGIGRIKIERSLPYIPVQHGDFLVFPYIPAVIFTGNLGDAFINQYFRGPGFIHIDPVHAFIQQEYPAVRGLYFDIPFIVEIFDIQVYTAFRKSEDGIGFSQFRYAVKLYFRIEIQAKVIQAAQVNFETAFRRTDAVFFKNRKIDGGLFIGIIVAPLNEGFSLHEFNPQQLCIVIILGLKSFRVVFV